MESPSHIANLQLRLNSSKVLLDLGTASTPSKLVASRGSGGVILNNGETEVDCGGPCPPCTPPCSEYGGSGGLCSGTKINFTDVYDCSMSCRCWNLHL